MPHFQKFAIRQEFHLLRRVFIAMRGVQPARTLRQPRRLGEVQDTTLGLTQFFQRECGLARTRRADQHQRRWQGVDGILGIIEGQRAVEQVELTAPGVQVAGGFGSDGRLIGRDRLLDQRLIHPRTAQKTRFVIGVLGDDFQRQTGRGVLVAHELHQ